MHHPSVQKLRLTCLFLLSGMLLHAAPAIPTTLLKRQPDGSVLPVSIKGDERMHWFETTDGYTLLKNAKNELEYAVKDAAGNLKLSGIIARPKGNRLSLESQFLKQLPKNNGFSEKQSTTLQSRWQTRINPQQLVGTGQFFKPSIITKKGKNQLAFSPLGSKKLLMILIQFPDRSFNYTKQDFHNLMNEVNYNAGGAEGSTRDYFLEMSYGKFDVQTDVVGIYTAKNNLSYYGADSDIDNDTYAAELMEEAITYANADIDFSKYDNDGDGEVDGVYIIYAGYGQATSGIDNTIWPHAGGISGMTFDGLKVSKYSCSNELNYHGTTEGLPDETQKELTSIGVICHEFGHVCGAPDYYDTDYETQGSFSGTGFWDLMDIGLYNGTLSGSMPAHLNPFEKIRAGWIKPVILTNPTTLSIPDVTTHPVVYIYPTKTEGEYYYMENRQQVGFNAKCPGHGLLIYHYSKTYWDISANKTAPQGFYPVCANASESPTVTSEIGSYGNIHSSSCPFPGSTLKTSFTDATTPTARSWNGELTEKPITSIEETNGDINLTFISQPAVNPVLLFEAKGVDASHIAFSWTPNTANNNVIIAVNTVPQFASLENGKTYQPGDALIGGGTIVYAGSQTSYTQANLNESTSYYYQLWAYNSSLQYATPISANAVTGQRSLTTFPLMEGFEDGSIPSSWRQEYARDTLDWLIKTRGVNGNPAAAHNGNNLLRISDLTWGDYSTKLIFPPFDLEGATAPTLKFWHTQAEWNNNQDILKVYYRTSLASEWKLLAQYLKPITDWTLETLTLPEPGATYYIAFEGMPSSGYGVCLDDIEVWKNGVMSKNLWNGNADSNWFNPLNWSWNIVPSASVDVEIPSDCTHYPLIDAENATGRDLTIDANATLSMSPSATYTLSITGNWQNNGTFTSGVGCVSFDNKETDQLIDGVSPTNFYRLKLNKGTQDKVLEATSIITLTAAPANSNAPMELLGGTFKLSSASTIRPFQSGTTIHSNDGIWINSGKLDLSGYTLFIQGLFKQTAGNTVVSYLRSYSNTCQFIIEGGEVNVTGSFGPYNDNNYTATYIQRGGDLVLDANHSTIPFNLSTSGSTFIMEGGRILLKKASTAAADFQNLAENGSVTGGVLQLGGSTSGSPTLRINSKQPIYNVQIGAVSTPHVNLMDTLRVLNDVTVITGSSINLQDKELKVGGDWYDNGGLFEGSGNGAVRFFGTATHSLQSASNVTPTFVKVVADGSGALVYEGPNTLTITGTLHITPGSSVLIPAGKQLTVNSLVNEAGNEGLVLKSGTAGTATFLDGSTPQTTIPATVQQQLTGGQTGFISTAVSNATFGSAFSTADNSLYRFDETISQPAFIPVTASGFNLEPGKGYKIQPTVDSVGLYRGFLNSGTINVVPTFTHPTEPMSGFNLVGNPYPSYLDWKRVTKTNTAGSLWKQVQTTGGVSAISTFNGLIGTNLGGGEADGFVAPTEAFWVRVADSNTPASLSFDNSMRLHANQVATRKQTNMSGVSLTTVLRVRVSSDNNYDEALLLPYADASNTLDTWDAVKLTNNNPLLSEISTLSGPIELAINCVNSLLANTSYPLGFRTFKEGDNTIQVLGSSTLTNGLKVFLLDNVTHVQSNLSENAYTFHADSGYTADRFVLSLQVPTGLENPASTEGLAIVSDKQGRVTVTLPYSSTPYIVRIYTLTGQLISTHESVNGSLLVGKLTGGVYLLNAKTNGKTLKQKFVVD